MDKNKEMETNKKQEQTTERETSARFCKAFYDEAREIEARAKKVDLEVDEARMEAMYQRMMAKMDSGNAGNSDENSETMAESTSGKVVTMPGKSSRHMLRWVAVLALVCAGVFGVSMQSQAGKDGLWSSIQRLIGVESRWEQKNNDEDREYSNPEEVKAVKEIESVLQSMIPKFFYWPEDVTFIAYEVDASAEYFLISYQGQSGMIYFEGWYGAADTSGINSWEGKGDSIYKKYDGIEYKVSKVEGEKEYYYVDWNTDVAHFALSGIDDMQEIEKILKNIKN